MGKNNGESKRGREAKIEKLKNRLRRNDRHRERDIVT